MEEKKEIPREKKPKVLKEQTPRQKWDATIKARGEWQAVKGYKHPEPRAVRIVSYDYN